MRLSLLIRPIGSWEPDRSIYIEIQIPQQKFTSGRATHHTVKTWQATILMTADPSQLFKGENPGAVVDANATVHLLDGDDSEPTGAESIGRLAI